MLVGVHQVERARDRPQCIFSAPVHFLCNSIGPQFMTCDNTAGLGTLLVIPGMRDRRKAWRCESKGCALRQMPEETAQIHGLCR